MFDIFRKKCYLVDCLGDFYDVHSHLMWGVDDGCRSAEHTTQLAAELVKLGFKGAYLTPHIITGLYGNNTEKGLREKLSEMPDVSPLEIRLAAEYHLDEGFMAHVESEEPMLTLGEEYVLVEYGLGAGRASHQNELFETALSGKSIIIAHPERYAFVAEGHNYGELSQLTSKNYALQLNLLSLTGFHGSASRKAAEKLLLEGSYTFVGSDSHSRVYTKAIREGVISPKVVQPLRELMDNNKRILWKKA
jgi:tyrosine-protein phosphatase YwqE